MTPRAAVRAPHRPARARLRRRLPVARRSIPPTCRGATRSRSQPWVSYARDRRPHAACRDVRREGGRRGRRRAPTSRSRCSPASTTRSATSTSTPARRAASPTASAIRRSGSSAACATATTLPRHQGFEDSDDDGILDKDDACPNEAEDEDGFQDSDGCPEPDNDEDGIPDGARRVPRAPRRRAHDGCPAKTYVKIEDGKIYIFGKVQFATGSDRIDKRSEPLLDQIGQALDANPQVKHIRIEGHTDNVGGTSINQRLSERARGRRSRQALEQARRRRRSADDPRLRRDPTDRAEQGRRPAARRTAASSSSSREVSNEARHRCIAASLVASAVRHTPRRRSRRHRVRPAALRRRADDRPARPTTPTSSNERDLVGDANGARRPARVRRAVPLPADPARRGSGARRRRSTRTRGAWSSISTAICATYELLIARRRHRRRAPARCRCSRTTP